MSYMETFGKRLRELREQNETPQQKIADLLGVSRQSLSLYEKAERTVSIETVGKIADFFHVSADYLLGLSDCKSVEQDMQTACKVTGLSEKAIENIKFIIDFPLFMPAIDEINKKKYYLLLQEREWEKTESDKKVARVINFLFETPLFFTLLDNLSSAMIKMESLKLDIQQIKSEIDTNNDMCTISTYFQEKESISQARLCLLDVYENAKSIVEFYVKEQENTTHGKHNETDE